MLIVLRKLRLIYSVFVLSLNGFVSGFTLFVLTLPNYIVQN